jgi:demethylmacrocin O-methyltransferase
MKHLTKIGIQSNTDKATYHLYTEHYDNIFSKFKSPRILEIGVANYNSIDMYLNYFENPYIVGMDIFDKSHLVNEKWKFVQGDQSNILDLQKCVVNEDLYDIIIDDGGHSMKQQQITFGFLIDYVKPGGYYILEDLHTSLRNEYIESDCQYTSLDMLRKISNHELNFSNYINGKQQKHILEKIQSIDIILKEENNYYDSVTSIIKTK